MYNFFIGFGLLFSRYLGMFWYIVDFVLVFGVGWGYLEMFEMSFLFFMDL